MKPFEWDDDYLIDISGLDSHHKQLVNLLNKAYCESLNESTVGDLDLTLVELLDYAAFHLEYEALMIVTSAHSISEKHLNDKNRYQSKILRIQNYYFHPDRNSAPKILTFMNRWITNHITEAKTFFRAMSLLSESP